MATGDVRLSRFPRRDFSSPLPQNGQKVQSSLQGASEFSFNSPPLANLLLQASPPKLLLSLLPSYPSSTPPNLVITLSDASYSPLPTLLSRPLTRSKPSKLTASLHTSSTLPPALREWIFTLFEHNMRAM